MKKMRQEVLIKRYRYKTNSQLLRNRNAHLACTAKLACFFFLSNLKTAMRSQSHMRPGRPGPYRATCSCAGAGVMGRAFVQWSFFSKTSGQPQRCQAGLHPGQRNVPAHSHFLNIKADDSQSASAGGQPHAQRRSSTHVRRPCHAAAVGVARYPNHHKLFFSPIIYSQNEQSKRSGQAPKFKKVNQNFKNTSKALNFEQGTE